MRSAPFRRSVLLATALALAACGGSSLPAPVPVVCDVEQSPNACFRCQAQRCGAEVDRCYGTGFHEGRSVGTPVQGRCLWNADTGKYDRNCTFSGGLAGDARSSGAPCDDLALCVQSCGCGTDCTTTCTQKQRDPAVTTYYANDPRIESSCPACLSTFVSACVKQSCAAECGDGSDAGR
jgi:hypothetical protein